MPTPASNRSLLVLCCAFAVAAPVAADDHVVVSARANTSYTQRKFDGAEVRAESYVFGEGSFFGGITADRSLDRMPFRKIAESLAPELARQQFWPAKDLASSDLLIVVHWGVTTPHQSMQEARDVTTLSFDPRDIAQTDNRAADQLLKESLGNDDTAGKGDPPPSEIAASLAGWEVAPSLELMKGFSDAAARNFREASNAQLLGYTRELRRLGTTPFGSAEETVLRADLTSERYLVILCAYDLKSPIASGQKRRPVWVTHLNVRAAGTNFALALGRMGQIGEKFFGRNTDAPTTVRAKVREGRAIPGELIILGTEEPTTAPKKK